MNIDIEFQDEIYFFSISGIGTIHQAKLHNKTKRGDHFKIYYGESGKMSCIWRGPNVENIPENVMNVILKHFLIRSLYHLSNVD